MKKIFFFLLLSSAILLSCNKEKSYVYDVNTVNVNQDNGDKSNVKTTEEFVSIAYKDLFGTEISQVKLLQLNLAYNSFGDKKLIEDRIIRNFLNEPGIIIPAKQTMTADPNAFITNSYKKFFNRSAGEFEKFYLTNLIQTDTSITPETIYYSLMTSNEYRYY